MIRFHLLCVTQAILAQLACRSARSLVQKNIGLAGIRQRPLQVQQQVLVSGMECWLLAHDFAVACDRR
jgi:hypothetical protein